MVTRRQEAIKRKPRRPPEVPITEEEQEPSDVFSLLSDLYPEYGVARWQSPAEAEKILGTLMGEDPTAFIQDLYRRDTDKAEQILISLGAEPEEIAGISTQVQDIEGIVTAVFPSLTSEELMGYIETDFDSFVSDMQGHTEAKAGLLKQLGYNKSEIDNFYGLAIPKATSQIPVFNEWVAEKGFTPESIASNLRDMGMAEELIPQAVEASMSELRAIYEYDHNFGIWGTAMGELDKIFISDAGRIPEVAKVFGQTLLKLPRQTAAAILQAAQGQGGASVVDKDWADRFIEGAQEDLEKFMGDIAEQYPNSQLMTELSTLSQNLAFSITSMGAGLAAGVPVALIPVPGARYYAYASGTAASGFVAYQMTTYQIMQRYLEAKDAEKRNEFGIGLTQFEEDELKKEFHNLAVKYGLWEAIPEAISNLAFFSILTAPLTSMIGKNMATRIISKIAGIYGQEFLTEAVTQLEQHNIEIEAGLREGELRKWTSPADWVTSLREIAPQTFLLTTVMMGAGQVIISSKTAIQKAKASLTEEIGVNHPQYDELIENIGNNLDEAVITEPVAEEVVEEVPAVPEGVRTLPLEEVSKLETRIPIDLIRKDEASEIRRLTEEIRREGIREPIVIRIREDGSRIVWDGIHRLIVAQDLGIKNIPVRFIGEEGLAARKPPTKPKSPTPEVAKPPVKPAEVVPKDVQILVDELKRLERGETLTDTEMLRIKRISPQFEENIRLAGRDEAEVEGVNIAIEDLMTKTEFDTYRDFFYRGTDEGRLVANEMARKVLIKNGWLFNLDDGQWYTPINTRLKNNELIEEKLNIYEADIDALRSDAEDLLAPPVVEVATVPEVARKYKEYDLRVEPNRWGNKLYDKYGGDNIIAYDEGGKEIGRLFYMQNTPESGLGISIGVNPEHQRKGIATAMVRMAQDITGRGIAGQEANVEGRPFLESLEREEYVSKPPVVAKPPVTPVVPIEADNSGVVPTESIQKAASDAVPIINEITVIERGRPSRKVFEKMGIYDIWESAFKQETLKNEELTEFNEVKKIHAKLVGRDAARRELVWEYVNNNKTELWNQMTIHEKRAATWFKSFADSWADRLGLAQDKRIKNYIPHIFDEQAKVDKDIPVTAAMAQMLDSTVKEKVPMPFLKKRLGKEFGLIKDPFLAATAYENMALKIFYYQPLLEKIKLIAEHETTPEFAGKYLKDFSRRLTGEPHTIDREINGFINQVAGKLRGLPGGTRLADALSQGNPAGMAAYNLTSALYVMWLGFKPTSAIRNLSQQGLIIAEAGPVAFAEGYAKTLTAESRSAASESLVIRSRRGAFVESIDSTMIEGLPAKFREAALFLFRQADALNVRQAFLAGYYEAKRQYPDADRSVWIKRGDEVAMDTQYLYTKLNSIAISQSGPGKIGAMLTTWAINYSELINKWVQGKESKVYLDLVETSEGRFEMPSQNWVMRRKALWTYMAIIGLLYWVKEQDWNRLKVWEYSGLTSLRTFANLAGGEFPALQLPGAAMDVVVGVLLDDDRLLKTGWNKLKRSVSVLNQLEAVAGGEKDWMTLLFYLKAQNFRITELKEDWESDFKPYEDLADSLIRVKDYPGLSKAQAQNKYREENPTFEARKFIVGDFTVLKTDKARAEVLRLIEKHSLNPDNVKGYAKIFSADIKTELGGFQKRIGSLEKLVIGEEAKYFTTSNYVSEINRLVKKHGLVAVADGASPLTKFVLDEQTAWQLYDDIADEGRKLMRQQNPELEASLYLFGKIMAFENPNSAVVLLGLMDKYNIPPEAIKAFVNDPAKYDELLTPIFELKRKWFELTTEFEALEEGERDAFEAEHLDWVKGIRRIEAHDKDIPETHHDDYVAYYTLPTEGYDQERFLQDNETYYNDVWLGVLGNQEKDFDKIPTVKFEETLIEYEKLDLGRARYDFRGENLEFDEEGVRLGRWKPYEKPKEEKSKEEKPPAVKKVTPKFKEEVAEKEAEFDEAMRELEELLKGLR